MSSTNNVLITGVSGLLGNNLAYYFRDKFDVTGVSNLHSVSIDGINVTSCDLTDPNETLKLVEEYCPDIVIHCAALTDVDFCELNQDIAKKVNVGTTDNIVNSTRKQSKLIYISTDSVYDGIKGEFSECDTHPINYYGQSKLLGEDKALKKTNSLILRTNIFGWNIVEKKSLGEWILGELQGNKNINGFQDAWFSSIYTFELGKMIELAINQNLSGIYNCASSDCCTKYEFALRVAKLFEYNEHLISPISIDSFSFKARRGKNLSLDISKLKNELNYQIPVIEDSLAHFYQDFQKGLPLEIKNAGKRD